MFIPHHPPPKKKNSVGWHRSVLAPCDLPLTPTSWLMELNLIPKGGTEYQWWTHSLQDVTLQHSGDHMAKEQMLKDPSMTIKRHYLRLMCNLGKKGRCTQAFRAAEEMKRRGVVMDVSCYAALIEAALHVSSIDLALETFRQMRTELGKNTTLPEETQNEFISACGFANQWEHAVDLLRDLRSKHVVPQTSAYFSVVRSCCRLQTVPDGLADVERDGNAQSKSLPSSSRAKIGTGRSVTKWPLENLGEKQGTRSSSHYLGVKKWFPQRQLSGSGGKKDY